MCNSLAWHLPDDHVFFYSPDFERERTVRGSTIMSYSDYSPPESPYYDDDDDEPYYQSDDYFGDLVHVGSVRKESSESSLELERVFGDEHPPKKLLPLKELCCRFVGQNFPFGTVQLYPSRVPEDVQRRISFWSFPIEEKKLLDYAKVIGGATKYDVEIARKAKVKTMIQSGQIVRCDS